MAVRITYDGASSPVDWPSMGGVEGFGDQYARHIRTLYDTSCLPLTNVVGTNDLTASVDPALPSYGFVEGMMFTLTFPAANTGSLTLSVDGSDPVPLVDAVGAAFVGGEIVAGQRTPIEYVDGAFRTLGVSTNADVGLGAGQGRVDYKAAGRTHSTAYQNTTGRTIWVTLKATDGTGRAIQISPDNTSWYEVGRTTDNGYRTTNFILPSGWYQRINGATTIEEWWAIST